MAEEAVKKFDFWSVPPAIRLAGVLVAIAASVAIGVSIALWSRGTNYSMLYGGLGDKDMGEIVASLQSKGIDYKVDPKTGYLLVDASRVHEVRLQLANEGLPGGVSAGFESLSKEQGFGVSQFMENARYQHSLETEISRSISTIKSIKNVRVHLAIPKDSVFARNKREPTASVVVELHPGRQMERGQVSSIVNLVATSVPNLKASNVSVVDQYGTLLTSQSEGGDIAKSTRELEYIQSVENKNITKIEDLLSPILGAGKFRVQVSAEVDFSKAEEALEIYKPDGSVVRSEQIDDQSMSSGDSVSGVPGALSNQPPGDTGMAGAIGESSGSRRLVRNYEIDKTLRHVRQPYARIVKLSAAVVIDHIRATDADGKETSREPTQKEIDDIEEIVKKAIAYDEARGDMVKVVSTPFVIAEEVGPVEEEKFWEKAWFWSVLKQVGSAIVILIIVFGFLRPTVKRMLDYGRVSVSSSGDADDGAGPSPGVDSVKDSEQSVMAKYMSDSGYTNSLDAARGAVNQDPKVVAQVVRSWLEKDG